MKRCIRQQVISEIIIDVPESYDESDCLGYLQDNNIEFELIMTDTEEVPIEDSYIIPE